MVCRHSVQKLERVGVCKQKIKAHTKRNSLFIQNALS